MAQPTDHQNVRLAKEGPMPGYTGHVPAVRNHVLGHSYSEGCKRGVAIADSLRHNEFGKAIHLSTEVRPGGRDDYHAQLSQPGHRMDVRAVEWQSTKREPPSETRHVSGKVDMSSLRSVSAPPQYGTRKDKQCIGTTDGPAKPTQRTTSIGDLPYKDHKLVLRKEYDTRGPEFYEVNRGDHYLKGYTGHTHCEQHVFGKSYGKTTRELRQFPAEPSPSDKYIDYADYGPVRMSEYELDHSTRYKHLQLLNTGEGTLGPLPEGAGPDQSPQYAHNSR